MHGVREKGMAGVVGIDAADTAHLCGMQFLNHFFVLLEGPEKPLEFIEL